jgi:enoyl-CoA hydratase
MDPSLTAELEEVVDTVAASPSIAAVVVTGGPRVFSIGADLATFRALSAAEAISAADRARAAFAAFAALPRPTVAAICGYALGGGYELALCCDRRVAAATAHVGLPEVRLGLIPGAGGTQRLARLVGPARAKDVIMSGRVLGAEEAHAIGMVDEVVAPDAVQDAARAWAAGLEGAPANALAAAKQAIDAAWERPPDEGLALEAELWGSLAEGIDAELGLDSLGRRR